MIARLSKTNLVATVAMTLALLGCTAGGGGATSSSVMVTGGSSPTKIVTEPGFGPMTAPPGSSLRSIDGSASNDVWAVGEVHHGAGDTLYLRRAHSVGQAAQLADLFGFALLVNARTRARHRARERLKAAAA
jgi:hypothetical protein